MDNIDGVIQSRSLPHLFKGDQSFILPLLLQGDGIQHYNVKVKSFPLFKQHGVWDILYLSAVSSLLPESSDATVQLETNVYGKATMALQCNSNNVTYPTGKQCAFFPLASGNRCPPRTSPRGRRCNATRRHKRPSSEITPFLPSL